MNVGAIWRYPVKSMAGEPLTRAAVSELGIEGDRVVQVRSRSGRVITSRTHPGLLAHRSTLGADGEPQVDGRPWRSPDVLLDVQRIAGDSAWLSNVRGEERFDVLPLLVATDGAVKAFGRDLRRLRPNLVIDGVPDLEERRWPGRHLRVGALELLVHSVRQRCVMTTYDPDAQEQDLRVLHDIVRRFGGRLALDVEVVKGGVVSVGDPVELV